MKILKKPLCLLLLLTLLAALLAGCNSDDPDAEDTETTGTETEDTSETDTASIDYDSAFAFLPADTPILTVDGDTVYWDEYFYWLHYIVSSYESYYGTIDWTEETTYRDTAVTMDEYMLAYAAEMVAYFRAVDAYAEELDVSLSEDEITAAEDSILDSYDSEEALLTELEANFLSLDTLKYYTVANELNGKVFEFIYGADTEKFTDEETESYASQNAYMQATHILLMTVDATTGEALSDEEIAAKRTTAEEVLALLNAYEGDDIQSYFNELVETYNEDTGLASYPEGYLFPTGTMATEFEEALDAMEDYRYSEIVETSYGYHIILRLPIDFDLTPVDQTDSLRYIAASSAYSETISEKTVGMEIVYEDVYDTIVMATIFAIADSADESTEAVG